MANAPSTYGPRPDDGWGPARSVRATGGDAPPADPRAPRRASGSVGGPGSAGPDLSGRVAGTRRGSASAWDRLAGIGKPESAEAPERGLPGWGALLVLIGISAIGGLIDMVSGTHVRGGFNIGIIVASIAAILLVRRSGMFPVVVAPPIVYSVASGLMLYVRSDGLDDRRVLIDSAANWLVYGFPAVAAATAAVLIIAGIRLITRR